MGLNVAYRWFLGYTPQEETPHFSTVSYHFRHRFTEDTVSQVFFWILDEVTEAGYLSPKVVFVDGTHIKANANTKKQVKKEVPVVAKHYAKELMEEVNADREAHGKKPFDDDDTQPLASAKKRRDNTSKKKLTRRKKQKTHKLTESVTAPESGLFVKGEHKKQFAYKAHTACDCNSFVLETVVTPGNVHDSVAFDEVYDKETIERGFADAKEKHAMRYTCHRGLAQTANWVKLKFAAMNLKRLAKWKWKECKHTLLLLIFARICERNPACA